MESLCPECKSPLIIESSWTKGSSPRRAGSEDGDIAITAVCPNPDCPGKETEMAKAVGPEGTQ